MSNIATHGKTRNSENIKSNIDKIDIMFKKHKCNFQSTWVRRLVETCVESVSSFWRSRQHETSCLCSSRSTSPMAHGRTLPCSSHPSDSGLALICSSGENGQWKHQRGCAEYGGLHWPTSLLVDFQSVSAAASSTWCPQPCQPDTWRFASDDLRTLPAMSRPSKIRLTPSISRAWHPDVLPEYSIYPPAATLPPDNRVLNFLISLQFSIKGQFYAVHFDCHRP